MENEIRRLRRIIARLGIAIIFILVIATTVIVLYLNNKIEGMRSIVYATQKKLEHPIQGLDGAPGQNGLSVVGPQGPAGLQGAQGIPGQNALSVQTTKIVEQPVYTNVPVPGEKGDKGEPGDPGMPGREIEIAILDGKTVWRYKGDLRWTIPEVLDPVTELLR